MQCYQNSGPIGSRCLKCTRSQKQCKYPVEAEEEEEEEEEEAEEAPASASKGKGRAVELRTPDESSNKDSESTPEGPTAKKKFGSGLIGALSKAVKCKIVDCSPEEVAPPCQRTLHRCLLYTYILHFALP